jgi:hypothetical protein
MNKDISCLIRGGFFFVIKKMIMAHKWIRFDFPF